MSDKHGWTENPDEGRSAGDTPESTQPVSNRALAKAALRVVINAYGTKPRHTTGREGGCRDDCIPCGLVALAECFADNGIAVRVAKDLRL